MKEKRNLLFSMRYAFLVIPVLVSLLELPFSTYPPFIVLALVILMNSQIRLLYLRNQWALASVVLEVLLIFYFYSLYGGFTYLLLFGTLYDVSLYPKIQSYWLALLMGGGLIYILRSYSLEWIFVICLFYVSVFVSSIRLRDETALRLHLESLYDQLRKNSYALEAAQSRLLEYSKQVERMAQLEERSRISRELHDSIGHSLTGLLMQVDAAQQIMEVDKEKGLTLLKSVYDNIQASIETVRQTVRKMRPASYQPSESSLKSLIDKFKKDTGVEIDYQTQGTPYPLFPSVEITLYQNTQEALTNAVRHGRAHHIDVHLTYGLHSIDLHISDDGTGAADIQKGFGLSGMEERLELLEGTIAYSGEKGFHINMSIPRREM